MTLGVGPHLSPTAFLSPQHVKDLRPMQGRNRMCCLWKLHWAVWNVTFTGDRVGYPALQNWWSWGKFHLDVDLRCLSFGCFCSLVALCRTSFVSRLPVALSFPSQAWNWCWSALDFGNASCSFLWQWQCANVPVDVQSWYQVSNSASFTLMLSLKHRRFVWYIITSFT